jgi:PAS domain S-box-containing protein
MSNIDKSKDELLKELLKLKHENESLKAIIDNQISNNHLQKILECAGEGIFGLDINGNHTFVNPKAALLLGYEIDKLIGKNSHSLWHHSYSDGTPLTMQECHIYETLKDGRKHQGEDFFWRKDGSGFYVDFTSMPILENNIIVGAVITFTDITNRKFLEAESIKNEKDLRRAEEFAKFGNWNLYINKKVIRASDGAKNIYGLDKNENPIDEIQKMALPEYRPMLDKALKDLIEFNIPYEVEFKIRRKSDGEIVDIYSKKEYDPINKIAFGVIQDITEKKQAADDILKFKRAVETSGEAIFLTDMAGIIKFINPEFTNLYGFSADEVIGNTTPRILKSGLLSPDTYQHFWNKLLNKQVVKGELINKTKDGKLITVEGSANPILDNKGDIVGFLSVQRDITERKKIEEINILHRQQLQTIIDKLPNYIFVKDIDGNFLMANKAFADLFNITPKDVINKKDDFLNLNKEHINNYYEEDLEVFRTKQPKIVNEELFTLNTNEKFYIQTTKLPYEYPGWDKPCILGISTDITDLKRAEEELIQSRNEWELTFNTITDMITVLDKDLNIIRSNAAARKVYGLLENSNSKVKGFNYYDNNEVLTEESKLNALAIKKESSTIELYEQMLNMFIEIRSIPRFNTDGDIFGFIQVVRDISERKLAEEERESLLDQLRISNEIIESELFEKNELIE